MSPCGRGLETEHWTLGRRFLEAGLLLVRDIFVRATLYVATQEALSRSYQSMLFYNVFLKLARPRDELRRAISTP